ncbi:hypothetical protein M885DRAFT_624661 [Pelagophyceae sp. CCMP2097]|nr:hypothetical protein M885DRAFT_624661 [Pelagophyceae sp. CCMP2097]
MSLTRSGLRDQSTHQRERLCRFTVDFTDRRARRMQVEIGATRDVRELMALITKRLYSRHIDMFAAGLKWPACRSRRVSTVELCPDLECQYIGRSRLICSLAEPDSDEEIEDEDGSLDDWVVPPDAFDTSAEPFQILATFETPLPSPPVAFEDEASKELWEERERELLTSIEDVTLVSRDSYENFKKRGNDQDSCDTPRARPANGATTAASAGSINPFETPRLSRSGTEDSSPSPPSTCKRRRLTGEHQQRVSPRLRPMIRGSDPGVQRRSPAADTRTYYFTEEALGIKLRFCEQTRRVLLDETYKELNRLEYYLSASNDVPIIKVSSKGDRSFANLIVKLKNKARPLSLTFTHVNVNLNAIAAGVNDLELTP